MTKRKQKAVAAITSNKINPIKDTHILSCDTRLSGRCKGFMQTVHETFGFFFFFFVRIT